MAALAVTAAIGFAGLVSAADLQAPAAHALDKDDLAAWLDGYVPYALKSGDIAGATVVVVKDGKVLLEKGYGYADVAKKTPMDPQETLVRIGSTSKLFTWTAVMQQVEQGKIDLDRDINTYLDFKIPTAPGHPITMRDLMNHRAGFEEGLKDVLSTDPNALLSTEQYLKRHPRPLLFPPGQVPAYSNYGAALAGYIVQRVSGEPFESYIDRHILQPLGMHHTTFVQPLPEKFRADMAQGYTTADSSPMPYELVETAPAGSGAATADDMAQFMIAHLQQGKLGDNRILSAATAAEMQSPSATNLPGFDTTAHGFLSGIRNGRLVIGHGGDTIVFHTELDLLPKEGVGIFYNFNSRGKNNAVYGARAHLLEGFLDRYFPGPKLAPAQALPSSQHDAQEIAGLYESSRRVEHGFISFFYLLQQTPISANADGTITAPKGEGVDGETKFTEVGPQIWREADGARELALRDVGGVKTVVDSHDPTSVLQPAPLLRSESLNLPILLGSFGVLLWTLVLWPLSWILRRGERAELGVSPEVRRYKLYVRVATVVGVVYLGAWTVLLLPLLNLQIQAYTYRLDSVVLVMELAGVLPIAAALASIWATWRLFEKRAPWLSLIWSGVVCAALLGVVWISWMGGLLGVNLNY